jgi:hypothetical protein
MPTTIPLAPGMVLDFEVHTRWLDRQIENARAEYLGYVKILANGAPRDY